MNDYNTHEHFAKVYGEEYVSKIKLLESRIVENETGEDLFMVLPMEAGIGKSLQTDRIIGGYLSQNNQEESELWTSQGGYRRFLIVKQFVEDVQASIERINQCSGLDVALGITSENWGRYKDNLESLAFHPVIIITHERYLRLAQDAFTREYFMEGRHTLIIDEALHIPTFSFSEIEYRKMQSILPISLHGDLLAVCKGLFKELNRLEQQKSGNLLLKCEPKIKPDTISQFKSKIEAQTYDLEQFNTVRKFCDMLDAIYANKCLYNNGRLTSFNSELRRWGLRNNIILDANGEIDQQYLYDVGIVIDRQTQIITHENWTLHHVPFNSSMSNIRRTEDYFPQMCKLIEEHKSESDKTLIVTQLKAEVELLSHLQGNDIQNVDVAHFGDIVGKNYWRNYTQVWIIANPLIPMEVYPLRWSIATQQKITNHSLQMIAEKGKKGKFVFKNADFEAIRFGCVISELYQAIKRINRDNTKEAEVFVVHGDSDVFNELRKHLKGIRLGDPIQLDVKYHKTDVNPLKKDKADQLVDYILTLPQGEYDKGLVREAVGIDKSNFARILKNDKIQRLQSAGIIEVTTRKIMKKTSGTGVRVLSS
ncbi:hypothetical protein L1999_22695 [Neobacillus drentensis]|uniref:hypothetical protein n=1 Tax=Neobacillus drentensis TaxID=220684 RepID=UPI001F3EBA01|nr:hypothetical protein [Neobacillus drentensis]ULT55870.1 hypothetical protein L1999_22695 [Neobacillus drentensis]